MGEVEGCSKWGLREPGTRLRSDVSPRRGPGCVPRAACVGCCDGSPRSTQTDSSVSLTATAAPASTVTAPTSMEPHRRAVGPMWTQHASGDELNKHQRWPPAPSWPPPRLAASASPGPLARRVLCPPVAAPDPGRHWDRECGQGALSAWAGAQAGGGNPAARADLFLPCLGVKPEHTPLKSRVQASLSLPVAPASPNHQGGLCSQLRTPERGAPNLQLHHSLPRPGVCPNSLPFPPSPLPAA